MAEIFRRENKHLSVIMLDDATLHITDQQTGMQWHTWPSTFQEKGLAVEDVVWNRCERYWADSYISRFSGKSVDGGVAITVKGPGDQIKGSFRCLLSLEEQWLTVRITQIDDSLDSLVFPSPIPSSSLVIPNDVGQWLRSGSCSMENRLSLQNNGLNMRWVGGLAENRDSGWLMIFEENYADSGVYRNGLMIAPIWFKSMGKWTASRSFRVCCTRGGYVAMAKTFRKYALEHKIFRTLQEKMADCPALKNLCGGRIVAMNQCHTPHARSSVDFFGTPSADAQAQDGQVNVKISHADAAKIIELSKKWGMQRGVFNLRGTFKGGYDESHPDIWPPEEKLGELGELKKLMKPEGPFVVSLHDNYQDMYAHTPSFPKGVVQTRNGQFMHGGYWDGGNCFIICPSQQRAYAERNWKNIATLGSNGYFIDTAACVQLYECFHPEHRMSRMQDVESKLALMQFFKEQGLVLGSENAADFGMYHLDFLENRHTRVPGVSIPLWSLVFHDAAFYARYSTQGTAGGEPVSQLENWLWGYMCYYPANSLADFAQQESRFRETLALDAFHARIGTDEMTNHKYLTEDSLVEQTEFSSGVAVIANFATEPRTVDGKTIAPQSHLLLD